MKITKPREYRSLKAAEAAAAKSTRADGEPRYVAVIGRDQFGNPSRFRIYRGIEVDA